MQNKKKVIIYIISAVLLIAVLCGAFFAGMAFERLTSEPKVDPPYDDDISKADVFIDIPNLRQYGGYTCGTTCVQMILNWLLPYDGDINLANLEKELGSSDEVGTTPDSVFTYFDEMGIAFDKKEMIISDLVASLDGGSPVMMAIQAWSTAEDGSYNTKDASNTETYLIEGHYVICVGYKKTNDGYTFYFNDPACVGYCVLSEKELDERWIDVDASGKVYDHFGIVIKGETVYSPTGAYHLD